LKIAHFLGDTWGDPFVVDLRIVPISNLLIHEEVVPERLARLKEQLIGDGILSDPILIDRDSLVVLDGTHRVVALRELGAKYVLVAMVDYGDPRILLRNWYRAIRGNMDEVIKEALSMGFMRSHEASSVAIKIVAGSKELIYPTRSLHDAYMVVRELEDRLRLRGLRIEYVTEEQADWLRGRDVAIMMTPKLSKSDVVEHARKGMLFPPKTTRHVFPIRPISVDFPMKYLMSPSMGLEALNMVLDKYLITKVWIKIEGPVMLDRYYDEPSILVFL